MSLITITEETCLSCLKTPPQILLCIFVTIQDFLTWMNIWDTIVILPATYSYKRKRRAKNCKEKSFLDEMVIFISIVYYVPLRYSNQVILVRSKTGSFQLKKNPQVEETTNELSKTGIAFLSCHRAKKL